MAIDFEPTAAAYNWNLTSGAEVPKEYELSIYAAQALGEDVAIRLGYKLSGTSEPWKFLAEVVMYGEDVNNFEVRVDECLQYLSSKIVSYFLLDEDDAPVPESLLEKLELLLRSGVSWSNSDKSLSRT